MLTVNKIDSEIKDVELVASKKGKDGKEGRKNDTTKTKKIDGILIFFLYIYMFILSFH
jgi:hypothetical protein